MQEEKQILQSPELPKIFAQVVENYTAGSPTDEAVKWTGLRPLELRQLLKAHNYEVSDYIVHRLLDDAGLRRRSYLKAACLDKVPNRNEQFEHITLLKERFLDAGLPVLSIDTKQKELLGGANGSCPRELGTSSQVIDKNLPSFCQEYGTEKDQAFEVF